MKYFLAFLLGAAVMFFTIDRVYDFKTWFESVDEPKIENITDNRGDELRVEVSTTIWYHKAKNGVWKIHSDHPPPISNESMVENLGEAGK